MNPYNEPYNNPYGTPLQHGHRPPRPPAAGFARLIRQNANIVGGGMLLATVFVVMFGWMKYGLTPFFESLIPAEFADTFEETLDLIVYCVSLGVPCIVMLLMLKIPMSIAFPIRKPLAGILASAIFICLGVRIVGGILVSFVITGVETISGGELTPTMPDFTMPTGVGGPIIYFLSLVVAPAIFEEAMFRGVILQSLRRFGDNFAVWVSAILFALIHGNLLQGPYSLLLGLALGYFVVRSGSILVGVAIHFVNNFIVYILQILEIYKGEDAALAFNFALMAASVILAAIGISHMRSRYGALFYLKHGDYPLTGGQKGFAFFTAVFVLIEIAIALFFTISYIERIM